MLFRFEWSCIILCLEMAISRESECRLDMTSDIDELKRSIVGHNTVHCMCTHNVLHYPMLTLKFIIVGKIFFFFSVK